MTGKQIVRALSAFAFVILLGSSLAMAGEIPQPSSAPQPEVMAPLPSILTAPAGEACSGGEDPILGFATTRECTGCSFEPFSFCNTCCGRQAFCIDTMDGGYCTC
jgi:hypothetical protein